MNPVKSITKLKNHVFEGRSGYSALESAVIFGPNACGKSNLVQAMFRSQAYIRQGVLQDAAISCSEPFRLGLAEDEKSLFEYCFSTEDNIYTYGFVVSKEAVLEEWLFKDIGDKEKLLFERSTEAGVQKFKFSKDLERLYGDMAGELVSVKTLFLTTTGMRNAVLRPAWNWFDNTLVVIPGVPFLCRDLVFFLNEYPGFAEFLTNLLLCCDTDICGVECVDTPPPEEVKKRAQHGLEKMFPGCQITEERFLELQTRHEQFGGDRVSFKLDLESDGTQQLMHLAPWLYTLQQRPITLVVDELDRSLHTFLVQEVIKRFRDLNQQSQLGSQIIMTSHDTNLMNAEMFRKDEIWLMSKDITKASRLTNLAQFKINSGVNYEKLYLSGRVGGIPFLDDSRFTDFLEDKASPVTQSSGGI
ncbi:MAG: ATP-binding protein [Planctomycetia bacterium]|nr:ATP-binding protein [Planctomycetia bacterium]